MVPSVMTKIRSAKIAVALVTVNMIAQNSATSLLISSVVSVVVPATWHVTAKLTGIRMLPLPLLALRVLCLKEVSTPSTLASWLNSGRAERDQVEMAEGDGAAPEQGTISQRVVLTFLRGAGQRCGSQISIKMQGIVHLRLTAAVAMEPSMLLDNGLQVVTHQVPTVNNPTTPPATPNTINSSTRNSKLVPRHSSPHLSRGNPYITLSTVFSQLFILMVPHTPH